MIVALLLAHRPIIASGFARMQTDWGDTRLVNFLLEHGYRTLGAGLAGGFWNPPIFYPAPNAAAYSEVLLSAAPPYWILRGAGLPPDTAFQWWMLTMTALDVVAAYLLLRRLLAVNRPAAALGAVLFAAGAPRLSQVPHAQLLPHFFTVAAVAAVVVFFRSVAARETGAARRRAGALLALAVMVAAQLYASFYLGWFLCFALAIAAAWALVRRDSRRALIAAVRDNAVPLTAAVLLGGALVAPLAAHYLRAARDVGYTDFDMVHGMLPRLQSWLYLGPGSWWYGRMAGWEIFRSLPYEWEHRLGLGLFTAAAVSTGLWLERRRPVVSIAAIVSLVLVLLTILWPGDITLWHVIYRAVPGAAALRAVSRVALVVLLPAAIGISLLVHRLRSRPVAAALVAALVLGEQVEAMGSYDKREGRERVAAVARSIPTGCAAFLYTPPDGTQDPWWYHVDAMWAGMIAGVPTVNGYSGKGPPGWPFYDIIVRTPAHERALTQALGEWERRWHLSAGSVCRVRE